MNDSTTICRHEDCGKRFPLSRYGNRTHTSEKTRKGRHRFCSSRCRVAHHRRMTALRGGVTGVALQSQGATMVAGGVTALKITQQNQWPLAPKITTEQPRSASSDWRIDRQPGDVAAEWTARELARRETEQPDRHSPPETFDYEIPDDLSIPAFLRREAA